MAMVGEEEGRDEDKPRKYPLDLRRIQTCRGFS